METKARPDIDARDIIARIREEMEDVIGFIQRPVSCKVPDHVALPLEPADAGAAAGRAEAA